MKIQLLFFGISAEISGSDVLEYHLNNAATIADLKERFEKNFENTRKHAGNEALADGCFGGHAVKDHGDTGRDQNAECSCMGNQSCAQGGRIAPFSHFRNSDTADCSRRRRTGAAQGSKYTAADHVGNTQAAGNFIEPFVQGFI